MCGIIGIVANSAVNQLLYDGLTVLQHRGQDAAGIATYENGRFFLRKSTGMVRDVFHTRHMVHLRGNMGIGHTRYPTAGISSPAEAQPFYVNSPYGIMLAHNGNLTNSGQLQRELFEDDLRHINTESDSEILLNVLAHELQRLGKFRIDADDIFHAVDALHQRCSGGYAALAMITGVGIVGFRDPWGIRPLAFGRREGAAGTEYVIASESAAIDVLGFELIRDVAPGETIFIRKDGRLFSRQCARQPACRPCVFEFVYLARPDSIIDGISVHSARERMGAQLARKIQRVWPDHHIDVVIPIPDTARTVALELAHVLKLNYREGFIKNRYIPRTFIMPGQAMRKKSVRQKLNAIRHEFEGNNVLLVEDSIVRGTTSSQVVQMARDAGARRVYFASAAPPVRHPNVYGIDMPAAQELIAHGRSEQEVAAAIGADDLIYQDLNALIAAVRGDHAVPDGFDVSCFNGEYITGDVNDAYLSQLSQRRSDHEKARRAEENNALSDLYVSAEG